MVDTYAHPARVVGDVIDTVRCSAPQFRDDEVMDPDFFRLSLRPVFTTGILEIADQFFFLGVDRNRRLRGR